MKKEFIPNSLDKSTLVELVQSAQNGDKQALETLYIKHSKRVYYLALKMLCNKEDAEDITGDVFVTVCEKIGNLREPEHFVRWLNRITANKCTNTFKKKRNMLVNSANNADSADNAEKPQELSETEFDYIEETNPLYIPEKSLDNAETSRMLVDIVDSLPDSQRLCVYYYYYEQLPIIQIAEFLDTNENAVKGRLHLARGKIRKELVRLEENEGLKLYSAMPFILVRAFESALDELELSNEILQTVWAEITATVAANTAATATSTAASTTVATNITALLNTKIVTIATSAIVTCCVVMGVAVINSGDEIKPEQSEQPTQVITTTIAEHTEQSGHTESSGTDEPVPYAITTSPSTTTTIGTDESVPYTTTTPPSTTNTSPSTTNTSPPTTNTSPPTTNTSPSTTNTIGTDESVPYTTTTPPPTQTEPPPTETEPPPTETEPPRMFTVHFVAESVSFYPPSAATVEPKSVTVEENGQLSEFPVPVWEGAMFLGWFTTSVAGEGEKITPDHRFTTEHIFLHARWAFKVTFHPEGGVCDTEYAWSNEDGKLTSLPIPTREGYTFGGWFSNPGGQGTFVTLDTIYFLLEHNAYAHWIPVD